MAENTDPQVLTISGDVDVAVVEDLLTRALGHLRNVTDELVVDLGGVTFIDSSGLGVLVRIRKAAEERGLAMRLVDVPPSVSRIFDLTGLTDVFFPDE